MKKLHSVQIFYTKWLKQLFIYEQQEFEKYI